MDRDLVLAGLLIISVGLTLFGVAPWPAPASPKRCARDWERAAWRALWWPSIPVVAVISVLVGWALVEPAISDEPLPFSALLLSVPIVLLWCRALVRTGRSLLAATPIAGTVGVWRPRVVLSDRFVRAVDPDALNATRLYEAAHLRHRDPLRIWLAQIITDLQWPWPSARRRFIQWRHVLELARDEEARLAGADGADLAAAVLAAAELQVPARFGATLFDGMLGLEDRVTRLLNPLSLEARPVPVRPLVAVFPLSLVGVLSGMRFGEVVVQAIVRWL